MAGAWDDASPSPNIDTSCAVVSLYEMVPILTSWREQLPSIAYLVDGQVIMDNRHIPAAPALDALLARAQQFAEAYWTMYPQFSWDGHSAAETFPNAFPWVEGPL